MYCKTDGLYLQIQKDFLCDCIFPQVYILASFSMFLCFDGDKPLLKSEWVLDFQSKYAWSWEKVQIATYW